MVGIDFFEWIFGLVITGISFSWQRKRSIFGRGKDELLQLQSLLLSAKYGNSEHDSWKWQWDGNGVFKCCVMAELIDEKLLHNSFCDYETLRNKLVPKKLEIFVWRTVPKRIPTRVELDKKSIDLDSVRCPMCDEDLETVEHDIIFCKFDSEVWARVFNWWKLGNIIDFSIDEVFKDTRPYSSSIHKSVVWQAVKWVSSYFIWKNRNNKVFGKHSSTSVMLFNEIQCKSYEWFTARSKKYKFDWHTWLIDPASCCVSTSTRVGVG
ncbi:uncharacterized protein [Rutidosis leptorrhynchoides]|uniref:uncharacterized protein n=1 Tax=Rutidosis leptorrhynchoides TaxID=125765 RepID=UPI003A9A54DC